MGRRRRFGRHCQSEYAAGGAEAEGSSGQPEPASGFPRFIEPVVLLILEKTGGTYGYQIIADGSELSISGEALDAGSIYRILRRMEAEGLVVSQWEFGERGPARRRYRITEAGSRMLEQWIAVLKRRQEALTRFMAAWERQSDHPPQGHM